MAARQRSPSVEVRDDSGVELHLRAVLEAQPVVLARLDTQGTFLAINEAGLSMVGALALDQLLGKSLTDLLPDEDRARCLTFLERAAGGLRASIEVDLRSFTGLEHTVEVHAGPHPGAPDGITSVLATFREVTELRRLEKALVEATTRHAEDVAAHESERARLTADIESLRQSLDESRQAHEGEQAGAIELRLAEAEARHAEATARQLAEIAELTQALGEQSRIAGEQQGRLAELESDMARLRNENESLAASAGADNEALRTALNEALTEQARLVEALAEREGQSDQERARISQLEAEIGAVAESRHGLESRVQELEAALGAAHEEHQHRVGELEHRIAAAADEQGAVQARVAELQEQLAAADQSRHELLRELEGRLGEAREALESAEQAHRSQLAALEERAAAAERTAQEQVEEARRRATELEAERAAVEQTLMERIAALENAVADAETSGRGQVSELELRILELETSLSAAQDHADRRDAELQAALADMERAREEAGGREARLEALQGEVETLSAAYRKADAALLEDRHAFEAQLAAAALAREDLEQALAGAMAARDAAQAQIRRLAETAEAFAREASAISADAAAAPAAVPTAGRVAAALEPQLGSIFGPEITVTMLVASPDSPIAVPVEAFERAVQEFAADRASTMKAGQATIEVADVEIDEAVAGARAMPPGPYVLWAIHLSGKGADRHLAPDLFDRSNASAWQEVSPDLHAAIDALAAVGTYSWLAREDRGGIVFELYLPRRYAAHLEAR